VLIRWSS